MVRAVHLDGVLLAGERAERCGNQNLVRHVPYSLVLQRLLRETANDRRPAARRSSSRAGPVEWTQSRTRKTETRDRDRIATGAPGDRDANDRTPAAPDSAASPPPRRTCSPTAGSENGAARPPPWCSASGATRAGRLTSRRCRSARRSTRSGTSRTPWLPIASAMPRMSLSVQSTPEYRARSGVPTQVLPEALGHVFVRAVRENRHDHGIAHVSGHLQRRRRAPRRRKYRPAALPRAPAAGPSYTRPRC